jgi:uncharacterized membrane protein
MTILVLCFLIGAVTGLRSLTPPAIVCWAARFGWLHFLGTDLAFIDRPATLIIFTLLAIVELIADKLPTTPARTAAPGLIARIVFGGCCGAAISVSVGGGLAGPLLAGVIGAVSGTFAGYNLRHALVIRAHIPDLFVALIEDLVAIGGSLLILSHF